MPKIKPQPTRSAQLRRFSDTDFEFDAEGVKFDMYVKNQELKQITELLHVYAQNQKLDDAQQLETELLHELMNSFVDDTMLAMDGLRIDSRDLEGTRLSVDLVASVREALVMIRGLYAEEHTDDDSELSEISE